MTCPVRCLAKEATPATEGEQRPARVDAQCWREQQNDRVNMLCNTCDQQRAENDQLAFNCARADRLTTVSGGLETELRENEFFHQSAPALSHPLPLRLNHFCSALALALMIFWYVASVFGGSFRDSRSFESSSGKPFSGVRQFRAARAC